jgi:pimeloyl-ACP methyl ester carboxylesterase
VVKDIDLWALWEAVTAIPTLLIRGEYSDIITAATAQAMQARHPQLTLQTIPNTGHAPALMDQSQIDVIKNWLNA